MALGWLLNLALGGKSTGASAVLTGSLSDGVLENQIFVGFQDVTITLSDETWVSGQVFNDQRQNIIQGFDSAQNENGGWNNEVRDKLAVPYVTRISDTIVNITLPAFSGFSIDANETITCIIPATALTAGNALTATPTFTITATLAISSAIVNADSTTDVPTNYEQCDRSGFRQYPHTLLRNWDGVYTRSKSYDAKHPQLLVSSVSEKLKGSIRPEADDNFLTEEVSADDL